MIAIHLFSLSSDAYLRPKEGENMVKLWRPFFSATGVFKPCFLEGAGQIFQNWAVGPFVAMAGADQGCQGFAQAL